MNTLTINECMAYFKARGVWLSLITDEQGEITASLMTPPKRDAGQSTVLTNPACVDGTDLLQVLNKTAERLKEEVCHQ